MSTDDMGNAPTVSIVVASHNKGPYVSAAIRSALEQGPIAEVIVVDDASTDDSVATLRHLARDHASMRLIEMPSNRGGSHCRNIGIREARGEFVVFLDADDLLLPGCCEGRVRAARQAPDHDLWVFPMHVFREEPSIVETTWVPRPGDHLAHFLAHQLDWSIMQPLWRRSFLERIQGFDESFVRLQDPELHVRAMLAGARARCHAEAAADCAYRVAAERHAGGCGPIAARHAAGAIHFYRTFVGKVAPGQRRLVTGTLLASLSTIGHWRRTGQLDRRSADGLVAELVAACEVPSHRAILRAYDFVNRAAPRHVPGLRWSVRTALGLPR